MARRPDDDSPTPSDEEVRRLRARLLDAGARPVVANHLYGLFELATVFLAADPPRLADASIAIDAMAGLLNATEAHLGDEVTELREGLRQLQLAYVQVSKLAGD